MKQKLKTEAENTLKRQMEFIERMKKEFDETKKLHSDEKAILETKYNEMAELFEQRPSRPEDLELIQKLQEDNILKEEELRKAVENLKFFKLELLNREDNYNKVFGANPTIGVLNPLDKVNNIAHKFFRKLIPQNYK